MKILFVFDFNTPNYDHSHIIPIGLLSLASVLKRHDFDVEIIDLHSAFPPSEANYGLEYEKRLQEMARYIVSKNPAIIGFTTMCGSFHSTLQLARYIKSYHNDIKIILGGPQASSMPKEVLRHFDWIDLICVGEGETNILKIVKGLEEGTLTGVPGIVYRDHDQIISTEASKLVPNLDDIPMLDYTLIRNDHAWRITMEVSRGCPYQCIFCATSEFWQRKFRTKSIERICNEIQSIKSIVSMQKRINNDKKIYITFVDDNFTTNYVFTLNLCKELEKLDIKWNCDARVDTLDEKLIDQMARSGCDSVLMGIESGAPRMQQYINKNLDLEKISDVIDLLLKYNIKPVPSFMYGFPAESEEDLKLTLNMIYTFLQKGVTVCALHSLCILGGTRLFAEYKDDLVFKEFYPSMADASGFDSCSSLIKKHRDIFPHFYTIKGSTADKYPLLDRFINYIIIQLFSYFPETIAALIQAFDGDILTLYADFTRKSTVFVDFFRDKKRMRPYESNEHVIDFLTQYIFHKSFGDFRFRMISYIFSNEKEKLQG